MITPTRQQPDAEAARGGDEDYEPATVNPAEVYYCHSGAGPDAGGRVGVLGQVRSFDPVRGAWAELSGGSGEHPPKGSSTSPYL